MPRARLGVVLLIPPPHDTEITGLRRACGPVSWMSAAPPHITLVPPVNVPLPQVGAALALFRAAAATCAPAGPWRAGRVGVIHLAVGPPDCFHPISPTLYLAVHDPARALVELRDALLQPPLERRVDRPFIPHVTIADGISERRARAAAEGLADYMVSVAVDRVHLLEERRVARHGKRWVVLADAPFEQPAVVGRGGVELVLHRCRVADPEVVDLAGGQRPSPAGADPLVISARRRERLVGAVLGWVHDGAPALDTLVVAEDQRGQGIARQLRLAFEASSRAPHDAG